MTLRKLDVVIEIFYSGFWEKLGEYQEEIKLVTKKKIVRKESIKLDNS